MVNSYSTSPTNNNNKCPHGFPVGACPICSGMGGAPRDRNKPRKAGEMSYNECLAVWNRMQARKEAKLEAQAERVEIARFERVQRALQSFMKNIEKISENLNKAPAIVRIPLKIALNILNSLTQFALKIPNIFNNMINNVQNFIAKIVQSAGEKIATVLGEIRNFLDAHIYQTLKSVFKPFKLFLSLFSENEAEEDEEVQKLKHRELKKVIKSLFIRKRKSKENKEEKNAVDIT